MDKIEFSEIIIFDASIGIGWKMAMLYRLVHLDVLVMSTS